MAALRDQSVVVNVPGSIVQLDDDPAAFAGPHEIDVAIAVEVSNNRGLVCFTPAHIG